MNMTKNNITTEKKQYVQPNIDRVVLDNEISLQLQSLTPAGEPTDPEWSSNDTFNNDPYKGNLT